MATNPASANPTILQETLTEGLRVIYLGPGALVASEHTDGAWYHVDADGHCTCPDHVYRERVCKHMRAAMLAAEYDRQTAAPIAAAEPVVTRGVDADGCAFVAIWRGPGEPPAEGVMAQYFRAGVSRERRRATLDALDRFGRED